MNDKPRGSQPPAAETPAAEDHIVSNLRHLFNGMEREELPERFRTLLEELAKKEKT